MVFDGTWTTAQIEWIGEWLRLGDPKRGWAPLAQPAARTEPRWIAPLNASLEEERRYLASLR